MSWWRRMRYLSPAFRRADEREMLEEMDSLAEIAGRKELGNLTLARENAREAWGWAWLDGILADVKYAFRVLARQRSFTAVAVVSLALGIGANAAIFSLMDALLWRQLPVRDPQSLVVFDRFSRCYYAYTRYAESSGGVMESVIGVSGSQTRLDSGGGPQRGNVQLVTGNYFQALGVAAALGRAIAPADDLRASPAPVAVLSHDYWQRAYGGDRSALGRTLYVGKASFTIIGVAPPEFFGVSEGEVPDAWLPMNTLPRVVAGPSWLDQKNTNFLFILGRLRPGVSLAHAAAALTPLEIQIDIERNGPLSESLMREIYAQKLNLEPADKGISGLRDRFSKPLRVVFWMVSIGLLLACVNVMSLQFARADERRRELTVRLAIGAGRYRIARQLLTESLLIALASGALGLALFRPVASGLASFLTIWGDQPLRLLLPLNAPILLFVTGVSMAAALISGVAPAMRATRGDVMAGLQQGTRSATASPVRRALGRSVAVVQMALSLILVAGACLFASSLHALRQFDTGVKRDRLLVVDVDPADAGYKDAALIRINMRLRDRMAGLPGVEAVSFTQNGLYSGRNYSTNFNADGFPASAPGKHNSIYDQVGPYFFTAAGAHVVAGRDFNERDNAAAPKVAILSQSLAKRVFHDRNPVGQNLYVSTTIHETTPFQIVGVVKDIRNNARQKSAPMFYLCQLQTEVQAFSTRFLVRTRRDPSGVMAGLRAVVVEEDAALHVSQIDSADDLFDRTVDRDRLLAALSWGFGILALTLAAVGIYGLLSYDVTRRTGEIGIRMAVGARKRDIALLVLREVALVSAIGFVIGVAAAEELSRLVEGLVFGFKAGDPRLIAAAALVLAAVAVAAALIPARRAARMDPMAALRCE